MKETTTVVDGKLRDTIESHSQQFSPLYGGFLSDHGPMAALAMATIDPERALPYLQHYQQRLQPMDLAPDGYRRELDRLLDDIGNHGRAAVLARELPDLISGWARDAYHPLIRTAYGVAFDLDTEIAAGLAYFRVCGPDDSIRRLAASPRTTANPRSAFEDMSHCAGSVTPKRNFTESVAWVVSHPEFDGASLIAEDHLRSFSHLALEVFAATHDFFALHLVTGAHAYRILYPYLGDQRDAVFSMGLLAGYAAVGAPAFGPLDSSASPPAADPSAMIHSGNKWPDEHDVKLLHSSLCQAEFFADDSWTKVAASYLGRHRG